MADIEVKWTKREKKSFMKRMLTLGCIVLTAYTAFTMAICWRVGTTPPDALTYSLFAFWGIEGGWTTLLKVNERKAAKADEITESTNTDPTAPGS